jgi:hypothetical protein
VLDEAEANRLLLQALAVRPDVPISDVRVRFEPGLVVASGTTRVGFFALGVEVSATVVIVDGKPVPEIVEIRAAGQPLGGFLRAQVESMIAPYVEQWLETETNVYFDEVEILEGEIRVTGRFK